MILADDVLDMVGGPQDIGGFATSVANNLKKAQRFVYEADTASALVRLAKSRPETLLAALPLCRPPFPTVWLEWPGGIGLDGAELEPGTSVPHTFGVLIESLNEEGTKLGLLFSWTFGKHKTMTSPVAIVIDLLAPTALFSRPLEALQAKLSIGASGYALEFLSALRIKAGQNAVDQLMRASVKDVHGEVPYVIAALCLLSAKAGLKNEPVDLSRLNKRRRMNGKRPFLSHSTVKLALSEREERAARESGMTVAEMRQHIVRGHFKVRSSGVYWWRPFVRGSALAGTVIRDGYTVAR